MGFLLIISGHSGRLTRVLPCPGLLRVAADSASAWRTWTSTLLLVLSLNATGLLPQPVTAADNDAGILSLGRDPSPAEVPGVLGQMCWSGVSEVCAMCELCCLNQKHGQTLPELEFQKQTGYEELLTFPYNLVDTVCMNA